MGHSKAEVAAKFVMKRMPWTKVTYYQKRIQDFPISFYDDFLVIIAGLDNVEARSWLNRTLFKLVQRDKEGNVIPSTMHYLVDGGTEGLNG